MFTESSDSGIRLSPRLASQLIGSELEIVVTGARGWLGRATLDMLESALGTRFEERVHAFGSEQSTVPLRSGGILPVRPLSDLPLLSVGPHLLVHYAFSTRERAGQQGLENYVSGNRTISAVVAEHVSTTMPAGLCVMSSGAVYLGEDLATNPYGALKLEDERLFLGLATGDPGMRQKCRVVIPRLFNLSGPFLNKPDVYVLGSILLDIKQGGPVRLTSNRPVIRSYVDVADLITLEFAVMLGEGPLPGLPFDTAGEQEIEVGDLAELAISIVGSPEMTVERPELCGESVDRYVGEGSTMRRIAHDYDVQFSALPQQIRDTARYLGL